MDATKEEKEQIKQAIQEGRVEWDNEEAIDRLCLKNPDFTVVEVKVTGIAASCFRIAWATESAGFGSVTFYLDEGNLHCDNEAMSRRFLKDVMSKLIDTATLDS